MGREVEMVFTADSSALGGQTIVSFNFVASTARGTGAWQIDDAYVDPLKSQ